MRKSFTWFLSLLVLMTAFATSGYAQEAQETVELYAENASDCYNEANDYTVTVSVRDFIQLTEFNLDLEYNDAIYAFDAVSGVHGLLTSATVSESAGVINIAWDDAAVTIGDNVKTDIMVLHFTLLGYPGNVAESFSSDMEWTTADFWYTTTSGKDAVNTVTSTDGALAVGVNLTGIETEFTAESCAGGDVTVTVTAPEADMYLFNEDPNPSSWVWTNSPSFLAAAGETVTIRVKDADGCMSLVKAVVLPETLDSVAFSVESHDPSCYGAKGSVVINATGGSAPYSYWIGEAADGSDAVNKGNFQFSMAPGTYYVNVQDANGCADLAWEEIIIEDNNTVIAGTIVVNDVMCNGGADGTLTVTLTEDGSPATDDYQISIDGGITYDTINGFLFEDLVAGDYDVVAKNSNGCVVTIDDAVEIVEPDAMTFNMEIVDVACGGDVDGEIIIDTIIGGVAPFELEIEEDGNVTTESGVAVTGFAFTGLMPTYYSLTITDANGCVVEYDNPNGTGNTIAVQSPGDIEYDVVITDPLCNDEDAMVTIANVTGGTGSYIYSFDGGATWVDTMTVDNWATPYVGMTVSVANADSACAVSQAIDSDDVDNPDMLDADTHDLLSPTCIDGNDGNIQLHVYGGTMPYFYSINGSSWKEADGEYTNIKVGVGTHTIIVKDDNDCAVTEIVETVTLESNIVDAFSDGNIDCFGDKVGTISVDVVDWAETPGVRDYTFYVENEAGVVAAFEPSNQGGTEITLFNAGIYVVWAVDNYTCDSNKDSVWVTENAELLITSVNTNGASCFGTFEGTVMVHATGGNDSDLEYAVVNNEGALGNIADDKWLPFDTYDNTVTPPLSTVSFQVDAGTYWLAVRDDGCDEVTYGPIVVEGYEELLVDEDEIMTEDPMCYLDSMGSITVPMSAVSGGAGSYLFTLLVDDGGTWEEVEGKVDQVTGEFEHLPAGSYAVLVEDAEDCPSYTTEDALLIEDPAELTFTTDIKHMSCWNSNDGRIVINVSGGTPDYWYAINNTNTWIPFDEGDVSKTYIVTETGTFSVWVKDEAGCISDPTEVTIMAPEQLGADIVVVNNASCPGSDDAVIDVEGLGGWATMTEYEFSLNKIDWQTDTIFAGLKAGVQQLYIRDAYDYVYNTTDYQDLDCIDSVEFTITEPVAISYEVVIDNIKCKDGADGMFTVNVLGGGTPFVDLVGDKNGYLVTLTGDAYSEGPFYTGADLTFTFEDLAHSHYTLYIEDANGCGLLPTTGNSTPPYTTIESWEVAEPASYLSLDPEWLNDVTCFNGKDGKFALHAEGGTMPYKYYAGISIEPDGHVLIPEPPAAGSDEWLDTDTMMVGAGTWVVWVLDANGCVIGGEYDEGVAVNKWRVKVEQPDSIEWAFPMMEIETDVWVPIYSEPSCKGVWDGQVYLIDIMGGSMTYNAHVTGVSAAGETVDTTYTDIEMDVAMAPYYILGGLPASSVDSFAVTVTDDNGCVSAIDMIFVDEPEELTVDLVKGDGAFTCADVIEGIIEAIAEGGTEPYEYQLLKNGVVHTPWQGDGSAFLVEVGNVFIVQVRDANMCSAQDTIEIMPVQEVVIASIENISCFGEDMASARISVTGEPGRTFEVKYRNIELEDDTEWTTVDSMFTEHIDLMEKFIYDSENVEDVHYAFEVFDDMGCSSGVDTLTFDMVRSELVILSIDITDVEECTATVTVAGAGGVPPYALKVNGEMMDSMSVALVAGWYEIAVTDSHLRCMAMDSVEIMTMPVVRDTMETIFVGDTLHFMDAEAMVDTMLVGGMYSFMYMADSTAMCYRTLNVTVVEVERVPPVLETMTPEGTITDNHPTFVLTFENDVTFGEMGYLYVTAKDASEATLMVEITADMIAGNVVTIPYVYDADKGGLDKNMMYSVTLDSGLFVSADEAAWAGIADAAMWTFTTGEDFATGVDPSVESTEFKVYPNPFNDHITIDNFDKLTRVVIVNIAGQRVLDIEYPEREIRTAKLVSGVYLVNLITEDGIAKTERIVKR